MIFTTVLFQGAFAFVALLMTACFAGEAVIPTLCRREPLAQPVGPVAGPWRS